MDMKCTGAKTDCSSLPKEGANLHRQGFFRVPCSSIKYLSVCNLTFVQDDGLSMYHSVRHIPEWLPWFSYKPLARVGRDLGNQVLYPPIQFVKESIVSNYFYITVSQNGSRNTLQLSGTALPSLALESLQELENQSISRSDRDKAEEIIAGALASMYSGQSPLLRLYLVENSPL